MRIRKFIVLLFLLFSVLCIKAQGGKYIVHTVAFYNFENFYDTVNNTTIDDEEFLPAGAKHYTSNIYHKKVSNFIEAACWPDDLKEFGLLAMNDWHFIDLPVTFPPPAPKTIVYDNDDAIGTLVR